MIKLYCEQKQGGFSKLMEAIHSIGLQVASVNVTTYDGKVLNILTVEVRIQEFIARYISLLNMWGTRTKHELIFR